MSNKLTMYEKGKKDNRYVVSGLPDQVDAEIARKGQHWEIDGSYVKTSQEFDSPEEALRFVQQVYDRNPVIPAN